MRGVNYFIIILLIFLSTNLVAQEVRSTIVETDGYVFLSEDKTIRQIRNEARMEAKRMALEKGTTYIKNITKVENYTLSYDLIESNTEGMLKVIDSKDYGPTKDNRWHYWIKAELRYVLKSPMPPVIENPESSGPLTVKIWSEKDAYKKGEKMRFQMKGNKDFYARVIYIDAKNNKFQLVPSKYKKSNFFKGNKTYNFPDENENFSLIVSPPFGKEKVVVYASTARQGDILLNDDGEVYRVNEKMSEIQFKTRGVKITDEKNAEFFETTCKFKTKEK